MKVQQIAKLCGYELCGEDHDIRTISYADHAAVDSLAIVHNQKEILSTKAKVVLSEPKFIRTEKTMLMISDSLDLAAVKIAMLLVQNEEVKLYGKSVYHNVDGYFAAEHVTIGSDTMISPGVLLDEDVKIGSRCRIGPYVHICGGSVIGDDVSISDGSVIGADAFCHYFDERIRTFSGIGRVVIEDQVEIGYHTIVQRGSFSDTVIGSGSKIGNLIDIGHDVRIGKGCKIVSQTGIAGCAVIGDRATVFGQTGIANGVKVGNRAVVMAQSLVAKDVGSGETVSGRFARNHSEQMRKMAEIKREVEKWEQ